MPIDLKGLNAPSRFFWPGSEDEWVDLRNVNLSEIKKIRKETITKKVEYHQADKNSKPFRYEIEETDDDKADELLWDYQIVDWNLIDPDGNEIKCDKANKLLLMGNSVEFASFVVDSLNELRRDEEEKQELLEKN